MSAQKLVSSVLKVEYTQVRNQPIIHVFGRNNKNQKTHLTVYGFEPYFYLPYNVPIRSDNRIVRTEKVNLTDLRETKVKRVVCRIPTDVGGIRKGDQLVKKGLRHLYKIHYESDIKFILRFLIDTLISKGFYQPKNDNINFKQLKPTKNTFRPNIRVSSLDIEVSAPKLNYLPNWKNPKDPILSLQVYDNYLKKYVLFAFHGGLKEDVVRSTEKFKVRNKEMEYSLWLFKKEEDMLEKYIEFISKTKPDVITAWNGSRFDYPYMIARMMKLKVGYKKLSEIRQVYMNKYGDVNIGGIVLFDSMDGYKKLTLGEEESYKLDDIAFKMLKARKITYEGTINDMRRRNFKKFLEYGIRDTYLEYEIVAKKQILDFFYYVKSLANCQMNDVHYNSRIVDCYCLTKAKERGIVLPARQEGKEKKSKRGAVVFDPIDYKLFENVIGLDLSSSYPSTAVSYNIGEDTVVYEKDLHKYNKKDIIISPVKGVYFRKDKNSFLRDIFLELLSERRQIQAELKGYRLEIKGLKNAYKIKETVQLKLQIDKMDDKIDLYNIIQNVVKFITNSFYGVLLNVHFRLYNDKFGEVILEGSRETIIMASDVAENEMQDKYIRLYGDTDSIYLLTPFDNTEKVKSEAKKLATFINKRYDDLAKSRNIDHHIFNLDFEKLYKTIMFVKAKSKEGAAKKNYGGLMVYYKGVDFPDGKLDVKGFDRSDSSRISRKLRKKVVELICRQKDKQLIAKLIRKVVYKIAHLEYELEEISFPKGIKQRLDEYGNQDWIRGARWTNEWSTHWGGESNYGAMTKPKFVYIDPARLPKEYARTNICALDDNSYLPPDIVKSIDRQKVIDNTIKEKLVNILDVYDIQWIDVLKPIKTKSVAT